MPVFARLDITKNPPIVIGFYDTDMVAYATMPPDSELYRMTDTEAQNRMSELGWRLVNGALAPIPLAGPDLSQQADAQLAARIGNGIALTSDSTPALATTFALDDTTLMQIGSVARDAGSGLGLPGGYPVFGYPDKDGTIRQFTEAQIIGLYRAMRDLLLVLTTQAQTMRHGGTPIWPDQAANIA